MPRSVCVQHMQLVHRFMPFFFSKIKTNKSEINRIQKEMTRTTDKHFQTGVVQWSNECMKFGFYLSLCVVNNSLNKLNRRRIKFKKFWCRPPANCILFYYCFIFLVESLEKKSILSPATTTNKKRIAYSHEQRISGLLLTKT